jgi:hypothetical protein
VASLPAASPTPEPPEYVMEKIKGTVLIKDADSTTPEAAEEEETVESGDEIITKDDSEVSLTLDENTLFHLGPDSDVKVSQLAWNDSNGFISRLELLGGKILSEVEKLDESRSTFEVNSGGVVCGVRGTAFEVQKQGDAVHMSTFHGIVEMKKDNQVQRVTANQHGAFSLAQGTFLLKRPLKPEEKNHYENWLKQKAVVQKRYQQRQALLHSMDQLSPAEKSQLLQKAGQVKSRDRLKIMRQELLKKHLENLNTGAKNTIPPRPRPHPKSRLKPQTKHFTKKQNQGIKNRQGKKPSFRKVQKPIKRNPNQPGHQNRPNISNHPKPNQARPSSLSSQTKKPQLSQKNKQQPKKKPGINKNKKKQDADKKN